jgi:hypothetical protein
MEDRAVIAKANRDLMETFCQSIQKQEDSLLAMIDKYPTNENLVGQCFTKLDKIIALKASAALVVLAYECELDSVAALGSAMYAYLTNPTPEGSAKVDEALQKVVDEAKQLSAIAVETAEAKRKTAERDTHGWAWKLFHLW